MYQAHILISGKVQNVFYRASCMEYAKGLGLKGWVRNNEDGSVEVLAQGEKIKINKLIEWCKQGPPQAKVEEVKISWEEANGPFNGFVVLR